MKISGIILAALLSALPLCAGDLDFTLNPFVETAVTTSYSYTVDFTGTLFDSNTSDQCDTAGTNCLYLNSIGITFDPTDPANTSSFLSLDASPFYDVLPTLASCPGGGILSDDSTDTNAYSTCSGPILGIQVQPNTPLGVYTGTVTIYGGVDDPGASAALATGSWTLDVAAPAPEPAPFALTALGLAAIAMARRRARA